MAGPSSRFGGALGLLLLSILFHIAYLNAVFDIYFVSPVTRVGVRYGVGAELERGGPGAEVGEGLAKRVVLIVGDGLRADKLFQQYPSPPFPSSQPLPAVLGDPAHFHTSANSTSPAPFIRSLIQSGVAEWGVSHTRVPTESRPGHVALIGGMHEDVSAVTRGWQVNPVDFDSVFNQSTHVYSFGSPDILRMFKEGASDLSSVETWSYAAEAEDFSADAVHLDLWVLDQLKILLANATNSPSLDSTLRAPGTVLFLHLLGCDSTGHSYRPHGPEYHRNIRVVDYVVEQTVNALSEFFGDNETAFVFTADHGMSSKGNHGDGEPDNTRTPLVAWGAGIGAGQAEGGHDEYSEAWGLKGKRRDVEQVDVAGLMSILAGIPIPANSAGRVPLDYLDATPSFKARAAFANANQILAEFSVRSDSKEAHAIAFRPFLGLVDSPTTGTKAVASHQAAVQGMIDSGAYEEAQRLSVELVHIGRDGLRYFQTYDWLILRSLVAIGYLGFMAYSADFVLRTHVFSKPATRPTPSVAVLVLGVSAFAALASRFAVERAPISYYVYAAFPCFFWTTVLRDPWPFHLAFAAGRARSTWAVAAGSVLVVGVLELMVVGYSSRIVFTGILLGMGALWPMLGMGQSFRRENVSLLAGWTFSCVVLAVFPALPVEKGESLPVIIAGGLSFFVVAWLASSRIENAAIRDSSVPSPQSTTLARARRLLGVELFLTVASMVVTWSSARSLQDKLGLPLLNQVAGWVILVSATLVPVLHGRPRGQPSFERLLVLLFAFAPVFIILSLSYEALFFAAFSTTLCLWMFVECRLANARSSTKGRIEADHLRIALFFLTFLHVAFFGVGNVASISSFYLEPVYRLIPVFAPFPMALLLLFKLLIPFVALSAVTSVLNHRLRLPPFALFIIASTLSDVLTINFFFLVTDEGSWLEIGSSITNFAICSLLSVFNTALFLGGESVLAYTLE